MCIGRWSLQREGDRRYFRYIWYFNSYKTPHTFQTRNWETVFAFIWYAYSPLHFLKVNKLRKRLLQVKIRFYVEREGER